MIMKKEELEMSVVSNPSQPPSVKKEKPEEEKIGFFESISRSRKVEKIIKSHGRLRSALIHILQDVQQEFNYLPRDILEHISYGLDIPLSQIYSAAAFYESFHLEPRGKHIISVCMGTACHVRGSQKILEGIERHLSIHEGETTDDLEYTLDRVNCLGVCALGPVAVFDGKCHGNLSASKAWKVVGLYEK